MVDESGSISIPNPLTITVDGDNPLKVDQAQKSGRYKADLARMIFANNDFSRAKKSDENYAKDAIKRANAFWSALPDEWKSAITGE